MNDCPNGEMRDLLPDLLHERMAPDDRALVEAHVAGCEDCREELALLGQLRATLRRAPAVNVAGIVQALPAYQPPARRAWGGWRAAAAIAALMIGGGSVVVARHDTMSVRSPVSVADRAAPSVTTPTAVPPSSADVEPAPATEQVAEAAPRELSIGGALADLSDGELAALLGDIETLDALPAVSGDVESLAPAILPGHGGRHDA